MMSDAQPHTSLIENAEAIRTRGYAVVEGVLSQEKVAEARAALDRILDYERLYGDSILWDNPWYQISYILVAKDQIFREICLTPKLLEVPRYILGDDCTIGSVNGYSPKPSGTAQELHTDRRLQKGLIGALTAVVTLDEFTPENGCTRVVPFSQNCEVTSDESKNCILPELEQQAIELVVASGSLIIYDASLVHASGHNRTNARRRSIHISFLRPWIQPEWDFAASLPAKIVAELTKEERQLYGFYAHPLRYHPATASHRPKESRGLRHYLRHLKQKFWSS